MLASKDRFLYSPNIFSQHIHIKLGHPWTVLEGLLFKLVSCIPLKKKNQQRAGETAQPDSLSSIHVVERDKRGPRVVF